MVLLQTTLGDIEIELFDDKAPKTTENFLHYVNSGFYDGAIFHRIIKNFMVQGGGLNETMQQKRTQSPIKNEADNGIKNEKYTVAMARTSNPDSASSQFFINAADNHFLNFSAKTTEGWGYCVFGKVTKGQSVIDTMHQVATQSVAGFDDVPVKAIVIDKASVID